MSQITISSSEYEKHSSSVITLCQITKGVCMEGKRSNETPRRHNK